MCIEKYIYGKKGAVIQNGDFADIYNIVRNFNVKHIYLAPPITYAENNITKDTRFKQINEPIITTTTDSFSLTLIDKKELQIIQISISNILNNNKQKICYMPIFKNVIFEKKNNKYVAVYLIILNLLNVKEKSGILKLSL